MTTAYDAVVVGAGPAGLSAAAEISARGRCLVIEQGARHDARDRSSADDVLSGVGGAGLFSDGKHSFYPSATALWTLPDAARLASAWERTARLLERHGVEVPAPPWSSEKHAPPPNVTDGWSTKIYPSIYASLEHRMACIGELWRACGDAWHSAEVVGASRSGAGIELTIRRGAELRTVRTRHLVIATGRLSPRWIHAWIEPLGGSLAFRRVELGLRIETRAASPLFAVLPGVDPKLTIRSDDGLELRTFCTCREGEIVVGRASGVVAISGRADGPPTGRSSVGLLVRSTDAVFARSVSAHLFRSDATPMRARLGEVLALRSDHPELQRLFGPQGAAAMAGALARFITLCPPIVSDDDAWAHGPCIEGVGDYPIDDGDLRIAPDVWIAGDASGRFRGIVASMISGRYVGIEVAERAG